ncbi:hypothetical protein SVEN_5480 [Streptomyces venezuelae ATCC 10712]|uniref:Uncharacterized protein n=1 Tax=Streptomyces venezuelae (strain ATCC 10712 / CBS 650.69 / DSM 40230 / JCM 4526 / NBRC 13096 / PD 04745) TaxID=953739 RepID=F2R7V7_STRVP|nr:hypothetical protein SVEN_5480 [Streptomyces venezuelae ATCC 10712]
MARLVNLTRPVKALRSDHQHRRCGRPRRTGDHYPWVADAIQPLDLGLKAIPGPPRVAAGPLPGFDTFGCDTGRVHRMLATQRRRLP